MVARPSRGRECDEFFKVYFPDQSSKQLRVPPACVKHFSGTTPRSVKLVDLSGKSWHVEVEEAENNIFFKNGWEKFASDHSLKLGNFLVFRYVENSVYDVTIFGNNGCVNEESLANQRIVEDTLAVLKYALPVKIKDEPEDRSCPKPTPSRGSQRKCIGVHLKGSGKAKTRGSCEVTRQKTRRIVPVTSRLTSDVVEFTTPTNPHCTKTLKPGTLREVNIPWSVLNEIKMEPEMVLHGEHGKRWRVGVRVSKGGRMVFSRGWAQFRNDNDLKVDDQCLFEFVSPNKVQVQILRASSRELPRNSRMKRLTEL